MLKEVQVTSTSVAKGQLVLSLADLIVTVVLAAKSKAQAEHIFVSIDITIHDIMMAC